MPTDYGVTSKNSVMLRYASARNAHVEKKNLFRYVTQRRHMPTSILKEIVTLRNDGVCTRPISCLTLSQRQI